MTKYIMLQPSVVDDDDRGDAKRNPYKIKPQNDLTSKFLAMMDKREEDAKEAEIRKKQEEEAAKLAVSGRQKKALFQKKHWNIHTIGFGRVYLVTVLSMIAGGPILAQQHANCISLHVTC